MTVEIEAFGAPRVSVDGHPLAVDTRKAVALLVFLALAPDGRGGRDTLAALLWPELDRERARGALRRTLSSLRGALGDGRLVADRATIALVPGQFRIDVGGFRAHAAAADLEEATAVPRGEFLEGFSLRDSPAFDDWQIATAEALRRELSEVLVALVDRHSGAGDTAAAVKAAERLVTLDPLQETSQRALIEAYAGAGRRTEAIRQYRELSALLDRELGVSPLPETTALFESIMEGRGAPRPAPPPQEPAPTAPAPPFVGRDDDIDALLEAVDEAGEGGRLVVVEGEAGIGKTRLVEEAVNVVRAAGRRVLLARAHEDEGGLSFNLVIEILRGALASEGDWVDRLDPADAAECGRLLPDILLRRPDAPEPVPLDLPGAQVRMFHALSDALVTAVTPERPGVIVLDDLHWADPSSLEAVTYLVRRLADRPICVVATWRSEAIPEGHRLRRLAAEMRHAGRARVVGLERLRPKDVAAMVTAVGLDTHEAERIYADSEGLPFFVVEHLAAHASGAPDAATVEAVLSARVGGLDELESQLVAAAAVIGRSFEPELLRDAAGRGEEETVSGLERLTARGFVRDAAEDGRYDFTHERLRSFVYEKVTLARRRLLHRRVAETLARGSSGPGRAALVALHFEQAGAAEEAGRFYSTAGAEARELFAHEQAIDHYERSLALGAPDPAATHEALGDLNTLMGHYDRSLSHYGAAAGLGGDIVTLDHKIGRVRNRLGEWDLARSHFMSALEATDDPSVEAQILVDAALAAHHAGTASAAEADARRALERAEAAGDMTATARSHNVLGILAGSDRHGAREHLERALALADELDDPAPAIAALNNLALVQRAEGDLEDALDLAQQALARCLRHGDRHRAAALHSNVADCLHALGRADEAVDHLKQAARLFAAVGDEELRPEIWKLVEW